MDSRNDTEREAGPREDQTTAEIESLKHKVKGYRGNLRGFARKLFNKHIGRLRGARELQGYKQVIGNLSNMPSCQQFYELMTKSSVDNSKVKLIPFEETHRGMKGLLRLIKDGETLLRIHPLKLLEVEKLHLEQKGKSLFSIGKPAGSPEGLSAKARGFLSHKHRIAFDSTCERAVRKLCDLYKVKDPRDIWMNGRKIFLTLTDYDKNRLGKLLKDMEYDPEFLAAADFFAELKNCRTFSQFRSYTEFLMAYVKVIAGKYQLEFAEMESQGASEEDLKMRFNIPEAEAISDGAVRLARLEFTNEVVLEFLSLEFDELKEKIEPLNAKLKSGGFVSIESAVYHYVKHKKPKPECEEFTFEEYFDLTDKVVSKEENFKRSILSQDGRLTIKEFEDKSYGYTIFATKMERIDEDGIKYTNLLTMHFPDDEEVKQE